MAYTTIEVVNILNSYILNSVLMNDPKKPNGKLCKYQRPLNSKLEDVVINGLPINRDIVQTAILNVNIYVLNLEFGGTSTDKSQPDNARIMALSKLANEALGEGNEVWDESGSYCFNIQQDSVLEDVDNQHYINIRVEFYASNN